ncbi:Dihydrolipoyllysine-residue acetyltransferase component of pyruvate dehydrogenase complex [Buchnera aphidicola (Cinara splendens)]|uniref:Dihydrolipoamide acetyltransferase component of pyruvate dehydrogenase complex n=1 Tax=Buchnera aphidicola (Cinara splendens) TaxID=2518979 RepID=A0A451DE36_9GAMM|nr:2-oxo acid dehydrogenase subunit E2 [Buchnera aphidicola]VFP84901.1 Dihydrolipoyllysine-residue acetyltransferase component of pyruvate dehydrogenase complex [Buchnera aphidicola (Cinara splendens)]
MDIEVCMPDIGMKCAEVIEVLVQVGDKVIKEDGLVSIESHKSVLEIPSPVSGIIKNIYVKIGDTISVNKLMMIIAESCDKNNLIKTNKINNNCIVNSADQLNINNSINSDNNYQDKEIYASPIVRRMARKLNINLLDIAGSGRKGCVTKEDITKYNTIHNDINIYNTKDILVKQDNLKNKNDDPEYQLLTGIQKISGSRLLNNWKNIPHVTQFDETDITELEDFRKLYNSRNLANKNFQKISLLSFIVKSVVHVLLKYPRFNSVLDVNKNSIILNKNINIGIAVDTQDGLLVPVLKNLKYKNVSEISYEIFDLANKAKNNQLSVLEMQGGSFTISSLGGIGGTGFTPIINAPESCILGISKATIKPIWINNKFRPRLMLPFSLSYDHRVIDGADGARFTNFLGLLLSDIRTLLV